MQSFDRDRRALIEQQIRTQIDQPELGRVTQVYEHLSPDDDSNFEVDVRTADGQLLPRVPVEIAGQGGIDVPTVGATVVVAYRTGTSEPFVISQAYTNERRPPVGRAGMWRRSFESGTSPAGDGDVFVSGHTTYADNPASTDTQFTEPEETRVRIAKRPGLVAEPSADDPTAVIEFRDAPATGDAQVTVGFTRAGGTDTASTWGLQFDIGDGTITLTDPDGFGIQANGNGDFDWYYNDLDKHELNQQTGPLNIDL